MRRTDRILADLAYYGLVVPLGMTLRFEEEGREHLVAARTSGRPILFVFWHNRLLYLCYRLVRERLVMLVSLSRDGDLIARVAHDRGVRTVRGSSSRGGTSGARALARAIKEIGVCGGITPDGPRGPRYVLQPGAVLVARLAGALVVPVAIGFSRRRVFRSWDGFQLPRPFARARIVYGAPVAPPERGGRGDIEAFRSDLERQLREVTASADRAVGQAAE